MRHTPSDADIPTDTEVVALFQTLSGFEQFDEENGLKDPGYQHLNDDKIFHQVIDDNDDEAVGPSHSDA